jgi:hypothetical protein
VERGETRVEKARALDGIEWHVYRMGNLGEYYIGTARRGRGGEWRAIADRPSPVNAGYYRTRREAIAMLCRADI